MKKTVVLLPILVPEGQYCWDSSEEVLCDHFDSTGGHARCEIGFVVDFDKQGRVPKSRKCTNLNKA